MKCQVYNTNFVGEREEVERTHIHVILLDSIKFSNKFCVKKILATCLNQIKPQILFKKLILNPYVYI